MKKKTTLADVIKEIRQKFGEEAIIMLGDKPNVDVESISTGSIGLDNAIGIGGYPRGRVVEIFGPESCGKTTLALHAIAAAQKKGVCAFVDAEHALDPQYAKRIGVKTEDLLISQPNGGEEALRIVDALVNSGEVDLVIVDSVASLTPQSEIDGEIGKSQIGAQARLMSQALRKLTASIAKTNTLVIFINQIRTNINAMGFGGIPETTAGGRALKFYASVRIDLRRIAQIKKGEDVIGGRIRAKVVKSKVASPFKITEFDLIFNEGISREGEIIAMGEKRGIITKAGITWNFGDTKLGRGYENSRQFLRENKDICDKIIKEIYAS